MYALVGGRLHRGPEPVRLLGANYLPAEAGCRMWTDWDPVVVRRDLVAMAAAGLNSVRLFVFWRDFAPSETEVDEASLAKLADVVEMAQEYRLGCVISVFTIWMNGERLDLPWRSGRSLWRDPDLLAAGEHLAGSIARALRDAESLVALDLGDEIANVDPVEAASLTRDDVQCWYRRMADAIRRERPGTLVLQANDASAVFGTTAFAVDNAAPLDLVASHAFPTWAPGGIESTLSYKSTNLASFVARYAAAYGPPLIDELGAYGVSEKTATAYLSAATVSALAGGAVGVFVWCWTEIVSTAEPYDERPAERAAGLVTADGQAKPRLHMYSAIAARLGELALDSDPPRVAVYLNDRQRARGLSYLDENSGPVPVFLAHLLLKRAHLDHVMIAGDGMHDCDADLVLCPSAQHLTLRDLDRLRRAAERGATVYLSAGSSVHGFPGEELTGASIVDFAHGDQGKRAILCDGQSWRLEWGAEPASTMEAITAKVLATYTDGTPALVANPVGKGRFLFTNAPFERLVTAPGRLRDGAAEGFYRLLADTAGVRPPIGCDNPDVEVLASRGSHRVVVVSHADHAVRTKLSGASVELTVELEAKGWAVLDLDGGGGSV